MKRNLQLAASLLALSLAIYLNARPIRVAAQVLGTSMTQSLPSLSLTNLTNQLVFGQGSNLTTVNFPASAGAVTVTMPSTTATLATTGSNTFSGALTVTPTTNQFIIGTTNTDTLSFTAPASSRTITFADPLGADSVAYLAATQTFTNKTLTSPTISGTPAISGAALSSGNFIGFPAVQSSASLGGSPVTLTAAQCGQAFALDAATGVVYILPATFPTAGCTYDFYVTVSVTSNAHEIETGSGSHFFQGAPMLAAAAATAFFQCNGTTHIAYKSNGTTTGGLIGEHIRVTIVSATLAWLDGVVAGSGTLATPCSTTN